MSIFRNLSRIDYLVIFLCCGLIVGQVYLDLKMPEYLKIVITAATTPGHTMAEIWENGGLMLACSIGSAFLAIITGFFVARMASRFSQKLRSQVFDKVQSFGENEIHEFSTASLITRSTNDITQVQLTFAMGLQALIKAPVLAIWAICKIIDKSFVWSLATGTAVAIIVIGVVVALIVTLPKFKQIQKQTDDVNNAMRENLRGVRVIRAYNAESIQEGKFETVNDKLTNTNLFVNRMLSVMLPLMTVVMSGLTLAIYILGCYIFNAESVLALRGDVIGNMMEFSSYAMQVIMAFMILIVVFVMLPRAITAIRRIQKVISTPLSIQDGTASQSFETGTVEFDNVTFRYPGAQEAVLSNINLKINKGETVAFIGSTGSGKSTLVNLIARFYDVTSGAVKVDGVDVRDFTQEALHDRIGYVSQKAVLFNGTVRENIDFGEKTDHHPTDETLSTALKIAQADDFVNKMDGGIDAHIDQGGANLSGGQKQRLSIARAIAREPEIYIFDDSFSALDYKTDAILREKLREYTKDATVIMVAQRIGTIKNADKIVVLENGKIVGVGPHKELLETCPVYREIALSQLSKEELENA